VRLSQRLKEIGELSSLSDDEQHCCDAAASVCTLVEAFQAAEQALHDARGQSGGAYEAAWTKWFAAKARLLEVNLG